MRAQMFKIARVKNEKEFYKKFPDEASFMKKHGKAFKKAQDGMQKLKESQKNVGITSKEGIDEQSLKDYSDYDYLSESAAQFENTGRGYTPPDPGDDKLMGAIQGAMSSASSVMGLFGKGKGGGGKAAGAVGKAAGIIGNNAGGASSAASSAGEAASSMTSATDAASSIGSAADGVNSAASIFGYQNGGYPKGGYRKMKGGGFLASMDVGQQVLGGMKKNAAERDKRDQTEQMKQLSELNLEAYNSFVQQPIQENQYAEPPVNTGEEFFPIYGVGTNAIGQNGRYIKAQNGAGGAGPFNANAPAGGAGAVAGGAGAGGPSPYAAIGQAISSTTDPLYGDNAGKDMGGSIGGAIGSIWGPAGKVVGEQVGKFAGWALDNKPREIKKNVAATQRNVEQMAGIGIGQQMQQQYSRFAQNGALKTYRDGGDIQALWGGDVEASSYNPHSGASYDVTGNYHTGSNVPGKSGVGVSVGDETVEMEKGEVVSKLQDGNEEEKTVVYGNLTAPKGLIKGFDRPTKAKNIADAINKKEAKINKKREKNTNRINAHSVMTSLDKVKMNGLEAMEIGYDAQFKQAANDKNKLADWQNFTNEFAEAHNIKANDLARGKYKKEDNKFQHSNVAQDGKEIGKSFDDYETLPYRPKKEIGKSFDDYETLPYRPKIEKEIIPNLDGLGSEREGLRKAQEDDEGFLEYLLKSKNENIIKNGGKPGYTKQLQNGGYQTAQNGNTMTRAEAEAQGHIIETRPNGKEYVHIVEQEGDPGWDIDIVGTETTVEPSQGNDGYKVKGGKSNVTVEGILKGTEEFRTFHNRMKGASDEEKRAAAIKLHEEGIMPGQYKPGTITEGKPAGKKRVGVIPEVAYDVDIKDEEEEKEKKKKKSKIPWKDVIGGLTKGLMPSDQEPFDWAQTIPEQYSLMSNKLEPVKAQLYKPELDVPYDISFQDRMNAMISSGNASRRMAEIQNNPAAQAMINAQEYEAINSVKGDQFRANQAKKDQVYSGNRATLNDAQKMNLGILDQQFVRQEQAKSNTKDTTLAALSSMTDKQARQKYENRELAIYENMYNYRYGKDGRAQNWNAPANFRMDGSGQMPQGGPNNQLPNGQQYLGQDKNGKPIYGYPGGSPGGYIQNNDYPWGKAPTPQTPGINPDIQGNPTGQNGKTVKRKVPLVKALKNY
jgi:hypothetical protein